MSEMSQVNGRFFASGSSKADDATLLSQASGFVLSVPSKDIHMDVVIEEVGDRLANVPRKIRLLDVGVFESADNDAIDALLGKGKSFASQLSFAEKSYKIVAFAVVAAFLSIFVIYRYGLPAAASVAASVTPTGVVELIDSNTRKSVDRLLFKETSLSQERQNELTAIFQELVEISGDTEPPLNLQFRDGGRLGPNAIALPGGTIILTDQLEALAKNDDELAGVFAHEIGHVEHQHSLKQIYRALGVAFMIAVIGGESDQIVEEVLGAAVLLDSFSYTRAFETEADLHSVEVMLEAGRDPVAFVDLLDRIIASYGADKKPSEGDTDWLSTHPGNADRRQEVIDYVEKLNASR